MKNKQFISFVLCIVLVASLFTGIASTASAGNDVLEYSVQNGDYLFKICKAHGLDYYQCKNAIMILNGYTSEIQLNRLTVGQVVKLPASNAIAQTVKGSKSTTTTTTTSTTVNGVTTTTTTTNTVNGIASNYSISYYLIPHVVQSGETLASICTAYGTTYAQYASMILAMNNISSPNYVWAGKTIYVPSVKTPSAGGFYAVVAHTVQKGENLTNICSSYGTSYAANATLINGLNGKKNLNTIYAGQILYIPVVASVGTGSGSGSGTGSGTVVESGYSISFDYESKKGIPHATVNDKTVTKAEAGTTINVIAGAKPGYALKSIVVKRADGNADIVVKDGKFTMPPCNIEIVMNYAEGYKLMRNVTGLNNGTFETQINGESVDRACYGDTITLKMSPKDGFAAKKVTVNGVNLVQKADGTYSFKMPNADTTVDVEFETAEYLPINSKPIDYVTKAAISNAGTITYRVDGVQNTKAAKGTQVAVNIEPSINKLSGYRYVVKEVHVVNVGGNPDLKADRLALTTEDSCNYKFRMPDNGIGVDVYVYYTIENECRVNNVKGGVVTLYERTSTGEYKKIQYAPKGQKVYIVASPDSEKTYVLANTKVTYANGVSSLPIKTDAYGDYFEMPDYSAVVTPAFINGGAVKHKITMYIDGKGESVARVEDKVGAFVQNSGDMAFQGTNNVRIYPVPKSNFSLEYVKQDGVTLTSHSHDSYGEYYEASMPNADSDFEIKFKEDSNSVDITGSTAYLKDKAEYTDLMEIIVTVNGIKTDRAISGFEMVASFTVPSGYTVPEVHVVRDGTEGEKLTVNGNGTYSYQITGEDVAAHNIVNFKVYLETEEAVVEHSIQKNSSEYNLSTAKALYGQTITIDAAASKKITAIEVYTGSNSDKKPVEVTTVTEGKKYTFIMPDEDVVTYVEALTEATITFNSSAYDANPYPMTGYYVGDDCSVTLTPNPATGTITGLTLNGNPVAIGTLAAGESYTLTFKAEATNNIVVTITP